MPRNVYFDLKSVKIPKISLFDYAKSGKKVRVPVPISLQKEIFIRSKGKCERCKKSLKGLKPHIHHKDKSPKNNKKSNLILLCPNCHSKQHLNDRPTNKPGTKREYWINPITGKRERVKPFFGL